MATIAEQARGDDTAQIEAERLIEGDTADAEAERLIELELTVAALRGHNAQLTRQQDALLRERDALHEQLHTERVRCEEIIAGWRLRGEASLETQVAMAAQINDLIQREAMLEAKLQETIRGEAIRREAAREGAAREEILREEILRKDAHIRHVEETLSDSTSDIVRKDTYIRHLEGLMRGSPVSLIGAWATLHRPGRAPKS